jgi:hypothetical protein
MTEENNDTDSASDVDGPPEEFKPLTNFTPEIQHSLEPLVDWTHGTVILGRGRRTQDKLGEKGTVQVGTVVERQKGGKSLFGFKVRVDIEFPHIMFLCGKRGSGKSYSLGIFAEELAKLRSGIGTVIIDPIGTFWSLKNSNKSPTEISSLTHWGLEPRGFKNILIYTPIGFYHEYRGIVDKPFSIAPRDLTAEDWCLVFDVDRFKTQGLLIGDAIEKVRNGYNARFKNQIISVPPKPEKFSIGDIVQCIETDVGITSKDEGYAQTTRRSMIARFTAAGRWGLFSTDGTPITELSVANVVTVIDVSHPKIGDAKRSLIVGIIARKILEARLAAARMEDATAMGLSVQPGDNIPVTWLLIDEAHLMLPHSGKTAASDALIEYAKLGRKPGCALILATQRPAATNDEILSQVDLLIGHTLALQDDIAAFRKRVPAMLPSELGSSDFIRSIPVGIALVADQRTQKRTMLVQLRPRLTHHAGRAAQPAKADEAAGTAEGVTSEEGEAVKSAPGDSTLPEPQYAESGEVLDGSSISEPLKPTIQLSDLIQPAAEEIEKAPSPEAEPPRKSTPPKKVKEKPRPIPGKVISKPPKEVGSDKEIPPDSKLDKVGCYEFEGEKFRPEKLKLTESGLILIRTGNAEVVFELYKTISKRFKTPALSISRTHPDKLSKYFDTLHITPETFWLSKSTGDKNIGPTNLEKLAHQLNRYIKHGKGADSGAAQLEYEDEGALTPAATEIKSGKPPVAILEGLEYLVSNNDFKKVLRFIEALHETVTLHKALGILPVNPSAMDEKELQLLEQEMDMCLTYLPPAPTGLKEEAEPQLPAPEQKTGPEAKVPPEISIPAKDTDEILTLKDLKKSLASASKEELAITCEKFGLSKSGSKKDMYKRIIKYIDKQLKSARAVKHKGALLPAAGVGSAIDKEVRKLELEREKLRAEREKLLRDKLERIHELEMAKLKNERDELKKIKKELGLKEKELNKKEQEYDKRLAKLEKLAQKQIKSPETTTDLESGGMFEDIIGAEAPTSGLEGPVTGPLTVIPQIKHNILMEQVEKQLDKSLFGRKREEVISIQPVLLPLLKTLVKYSKGRIMRKEYENEILWDTITGELVIDYKNGLKRTVGLEALYQLSQTEIKTLHTLSSIRPREVEDLIQDANLTKSKLKRALNKLTEMGLVERKLDSTGKIELYKRIHKFKIPSHPERIKFEFPKTKPRKNKEMILESSYVLKQIQKVLTGLVPKSRIVKSESLFYPYFMVEVAGEGNKPRKILIDAVSGNEDKLLSNRI